MTAQLPSQVRFFHLLGELFLAIFVTLFISSLITPVLYLSMREFFGEDIWPYSRVFDRVILVVLIGAIFLRAKYFHLSQYKAELINALRRPRLFPLVCGITITLTISIGILPLIVAGGEFTWSVIAWKELLLRFFKVLPAALLISLLEEVFFRFFLFLSLRRHLTFLASAVLSSLLYSVVHFIQPLKSWSFSELHIATGFLYLSELGGRIFQEGVLAAIFGLFLVGLVLCFTVERSRSLLFAIGLHSGWVLVTKLVGMVIEPSAGLVYPAGVGRRYFLLTEPWTWLSICLVAICMHFVMKRFATQARGI